MVADSDNLVSDLVINNNKPGEQQFVYLFSVLIKIKTRLTTHQPGFSINSLHLSSYHSLFPTSHHTSFILKGNFLILLPVKSKIALHNAGANGGKPGSPTPPGFSSFSIMCTSISGISLMRGIRY